MSIAATSNVFPLTYIEITFDYIEIMKINELKPGFVDFLDLHLEYLCLKYQVYCLIHFVIHNYITQKKY